MIGVINIMGVIGEIPDDTGKIIEPNVTFLNVVQQVESQKGITQLDAFINSPGGYAEEGDEIYAYLVSLKSRGIKVKTHAEDVCASIATKIFLAGDERIIDSDTEFMIHNPFGAPPEGDADFIESYYKELRSLENDLISFYAKETGTSKEAIKPLMKKETFLTPQQAVELGFATDIYEKVQLNAVAFSRKFNQKQNTMSETLNKKDAENLIDKLLKGIKNIGKSDKPKVLKTVQDANGDNIEFPDLEPDDTPSVGDRTTAEDGSYVMPSGETFVVVNNVLSDIQPAETEESEEMVQLRQEVDDLTTKLEEKETEFKALKKENKTLKKREKINAKAIKNLESGLLSVKRSIGSNFKHEKGERKEQGQEGNRKVWKKDKD